MASISITAITEEKHKHDGLFITAITEEEHKHDGLSLSKRIAFIAHSLNHDLTLFLAGLIHVK